MLPANLINALQALSNTGRQLPQTTPDTPKQAAHLEVGQQVQGTVQSRISEGMFKVQVAGQTLQMRLPVNIQPGDTVKLEVVSLQPRITFGMAASTNPLSTPEQIGSAARLLSNLAERPIERPIVQQFGSKAVWPAEQQAPDTRLLAGALREALGKSGLFYESHQAQWIRGERSINQLLEEPQNLLMGKGSPLVSGDQQAAADKASTAQAGAPAQAKAAADAAQPIAKELVHLVQQQLHTLEQHHLVWMGQVWPGQQMQWQIQGQPENQARQQDERQWSTEMELALPKLGDVHARLVFAEGGLRIVLRAADQATVDLFNRALPGLRGSLANAGVPLAAAVVEERP
jgi:translation initiation factor IF-1